MDGWVFTLYAVQILRSEEDLFRRYKQSKVAVVFENRKNLNLSFDGRGVILSSFLKNYLHSQN